MRCSRARCRPLLPWRSNCELRDSKPERRDSTPILNFGTQKRDSEPGRRFKLLVPLSRPGVAERGLMCALGRVLATRAAGLDYMRIATRDSVRELIRKRGCAHYC